MVEDKLGTGIIQAPSVEVLETYIKQQLASVPELGGLEDLIPITITSEGAS